MVRSPVDECTHARSPDGVVTWIADSAGFGTHAETFAARQESIAVCWDRWVISERRGAKMEEERNAVPCIFNSFLLGSRVRTKVASNKAPPHRTTTTEVDGQTVGQVVMGSAVSRTARRGLKPNNPKASAAPPAAAHPTSPSAASSAVELPQGDELKGLVSMITSKTRRFVDSEEMARRVPTKDVAQLRKKNRLETKEIRRRMAAADGGASDPAIRRLMEHCSL